MKKLKFLFALFVAASLAACSDDAPQHDGEINKDVIANLSREGSVSTYELESYRLFDKNPSKHNKDWEEVDLFNILGHSSSLESTLCFQDGKLWEPVELFSLSTGPYPVGDVWNAYKRVTRVKTELYVRNKFEYNEVDSIMVIDGRDYKVLEFTDKTLKLNHISVGCNSEGEPWPSLEVFHYTITTPKRFDGENIMAFDSDIECYRYILEVARKQFGRYIDLDQVYAGLVFLEQPIVDLDEVEAWVNEQEQK